MNAPLIVPGANDFSETQHDQVIILTSTIKVMTLTPGMTTIIGMMTFMNHSKESLEKRRNETVNIDIQCEIARRLAYQLFLKIRMELTRSIVKREKHFTTLWKHL